jgi:hypothetical protein
MIQEIQYESITSAQTMKQKRFSQNEAATTALLQCTPSWFVRTGTTFTKGSGKIYLNFAKPCVNPHCDKPRQQTISVGQSHGLELAQKVGVALEKRHGSCQGHTTTAAAPATGEEFFRQQVTELEKALKVQRAASAEFEHQAGVYKRKAEAFDAAATMTATAKRVKTAKENKRCDIDPTNSFRRNNQKCKDAGGERHRDRGDAGGALRG